MVPGSIAIYKDTRTEVTQGLPSTGMDLKTKLIQQLSFKSLNWRNKHSNKQTFNAQLTISK